MTREEIKAVYDQGPETVMVLVEQLSGLIEQQQAQIARLNARVKELEDRPATNSRNICSSWPVRAASRWSLSDSYTSGVSTPIKRTFSGRPFRVIASVSPSTTRTTVAVSRARDGTARRTIPRSSTQKGRRARLMLRAMPQGVGDVKERRPRRSGGASHRPETWGRGKESLLGSGAGTPGGRAARRSDPGSGRGENRLRGRPATG